MNTHTDIDDILARHFSGEPLSAHQQQALDDYIATHADEYRRVSKLMAEATAAPPTMEVDTRRAWQKVEARLDADRRPSLLQRLRPMLSVAASLLVVTVVGVLTYRHITHIDTLHYANSTQTDLRVQLPDGSAVVLSPMAAMTYEDHRHEQCRRVALQGKAFFDVSHNGAGFEVTAADVRVAVLGTSFTVDATRPAHTRVHVATGRVQVSTAAGSVVLAEGEETAVHEGRVGQKVSARDAAPKPHAFDFDETPIHEAVQRVAREMDVEITVDASVSAQNLVTTRMRITSPMQAVREFALLCGCRGDSVAPLRYRLHR